MSNYQHLMGGPSSARAFSNDNNDHKKEQEAEAAAKPKQDARPSSKK